MRSRPARFWLRLAIALAGMIFMSLGVVLLPWAARQPDSRASHSRSLVSNPDCYGNADRHVNC